MTRDELIRELEKRIKDRQKEIIDKYKATPGIMFIERNFDKLIRELQEDAYIKGLQHIWLKFLLTCAPEPIIIKEENFIYSISNKEGE
jgi:hypothetical protein